MRDFVEFNFKGEGRFLVRDYDICAVREEDGDTFLSVNLGDKVVEFITLENYDTINRILERRSQVVIPIAEHFTRDEYGMLYELVEHCLKGANNNAVELAKFREISNKLDKILKGEE